MHRTPDTAAGSRVILHRHHRPEGAIVARPCANASGVAVIYNRGNPPPKITIIPVSKTVYTIHADGRPVAVIACARGLPVDAEDVPLIERA